MPTEAKKVIDKYEASVEVARKAFDAAVAKARDQALKDLKPIQTSETKKGNLDGATLVKSKVEELTIEASTETLSSAKEPKVQKDLRDFIPSILGTWDGDPTKGGPNWKFFMLNKELRLKEDKESGATSTKTSFTSDGKIIFSWPSGKTTFVIEREGERDLKLTAYQTGKDEVESNGKWWTQTITKKSDK